MRVRAKAVLVVHRDRMMAEAIAAALERYPAIVAVGTATMPQDLAARAERADSVVLERDFPDAKSLAARLRRRGTRVVVIGECGEDEYGVSVSPASSVDVLMSALVPGGDPSPRRSHRFLSTREHEVLTLIGKGFAGKQVARHLGISPKTVENHKTRIFKKLGVPNQAAAVSFLWAGEFQRTNASMEVRSAR